MSSTNDSTCFIDTDHLSISTNSCKWLFFRSLYAASSISSIINYIRGLSVTHLESESERIMAYSEGIVLSEISVAIIILILSVIVSILMSEGIKKPIQKLEIAALEIAKGNLEGFRREIGSLRQFYPRV